MSLKLTGHYFNTPLTYGPKLHVSRVQYMGVFNFRMGERAETRFELMITCYDTRINYLLSKSLKLFENGKYGHITNILTVTIKAFKSYHLFF